MKKSERRRHQEMLRAIESRIREKKGQLSDEQERKLEAALTRESELDFGSFFDLVLGVYRRRVEEYRQEMGVEDRHDAMILALLELHALHMWIISRDVMDLGEDLRAKLRQLRGKSEAARRGGSEGEMGKPAKGTRKASRNPAKKGDKRA